MPSTAMPQRRIVWIDQAKGFLICLVLLGHSLEIVGFDSLPGSAAVWYGIYSFHMMAFFSVSGLLFFYQWRQRGLLDWKRIFRREMSLSVPTALFSVIHIGIRFGCGLDPSIIASILQTVSRFWFVFVLILIEFLVPVLAFALSRNLRLEDFSRKANAVLPILVLLWLACSFWNNEIGKLLGYFLGFVLPMMPFWNRKIPGWGLAAALLGMAALSGVFFLQWGTQSILNSFVKGILGIPGAFLLMQIFSRWSANASEGLLSHLGNYTLPLYLIHTIFFPLLQMQMPRYPQIPAGVWVMLFFCSGMVVPILVAKGMEKLPVLRDILHPAHVMQRFLSKWER